MKQTVRWKKEPTFNASSRFIGVEIGKEPIGDPRLHAAFSQKMDDGGTSWRGWLRPCLPAPRVIVKVLVATAVTRRNSPSILMRKLPVVGNVVHL